MQYEIPKITTIEQGHEELAKIKDEVNEVHGLMRQTSNNQEFQVLTDRSYDLKKAKHSIQDQMQKIATIKIRARKAQA